MAGDGEKGLAARVQSHKGGVSGVHDYYRIAATCTTYGKYSVALPLTTLRFLTDDVFNVLVVFAYRWSVNCMHQAQAFAAKDPYGT